MCEWALERMRRDRERKKSGEGFVWWHCHCDKCLFPKWGPEGNPLLKKPDELPPVA